MRKLTLNEKITLKGLIARKPGFAGTVNFVKCTMEDVLRWWQWCYGTSIADYAKIPHMRENRQSFRRIKSKKRFNVNRYKTIK